ncbi:metallophosphoesterase family protein [Salinicola rhizosphaerae]|uniref:3',5'-cyclic adenosine monophosphate phosphodiesterase CpdA n=1 Tax=Salinicola rhizosphaerae TaxID=1443141 RepID=A0ABQ3EAV6_9GAMM|nr:metallophosphoesterase [Salinicola rhizosphaerae]GHB28835.1 3',5'-cyclic adenosine monophosphate phosphodiesterase CpdA [Salinicola rhizosphaerae]
MRIVQITDCHLLADPRGRSRKGFPLRQLETVIGRARQLRPDILLCTGDIAEDETPVAYRYASDAFTRLGCPWFWIPGNHDQPELMEEIHPFHDELDLGEWRMLLLDSRVSGQPGGCLGKAQLQRLAEQLEADERPTLIALHHPPVEIGSVWMDAIGLEDRDALWQTLAPYPQVRAMIFGHVHQAFAARTTSLPEETLGDVASDDAPDRLEGASLLPVYGSPSTSDQFLPRSHEFAVDEAARPGFRVIDLKGDDFTTWVERVDL